MIDDGGETKCPICRKLVRKSGFVMNGTKKIDTECENEFYIHARGKLYRIQDPQTPWTNNNLTQ